MRGLQFEELVEQAFANAEKTPNAVTSADTAVAADGAYDTEKIRGYCDDHSICPLIPICIDFAGNANGCMPRKKEGFRQMAGVEHIDKDAEHMFAGLTRDQKREHRREWRKKAGYNNNNNNRWSVETAFSTFKRVLGECVALDKMFRTLCVYSVEQNI